MLPKPLFAIPAQNSFLSAVFILLGYASRRGSNVADYIDTNFVFHLHISFSHLSLISTENVVVPRPIINPSNAQRFILLGRQGPLRGYLKQIFDRMAVLPEAFMYAILTIIDIPAATLAFVMVSIEWPVTQAAVQQEINRVEVSCCLICEGFTN